MNKTYPSLLIAGIIAFPFLASAQYPYLLEDETAAEVTVQQSPAVPDSQNPAAPAAPDSEKAGVEVEKTISDPENAAEDDSVKTVADSDEESVEPEPEPRKQVKKTRNQRRLERKFQKERRKRGLK